MNGCLDLLEEIRAIAQTGLHFADNPYDKERYHRLMDLASNKYGDLTGTAPEEIKAGFLEELGYITPKVGVQGALFNAEGKLLLEKRMDDKLWGIPAGWAEVGESPQQSIQREFKEETNLDIRAVQLLGLYTRLPGDFGDPHTSIHLLYFCELVGGTIQISHESEAMQYKDIVEVTEWHKDHQPQAATAYAYWLKLQQK